jgi:hypothetical protein
VRNILTPQQNADRLREICKLPGESITITKETALKIAEQLETMSDNTMYLLELWHSAKMNFLTTQLGELGKELQEAVQYTMTMGGKPRGK